MKQEQQSPKIVEMCSRNKHLRYGDVSLDIIFVFDMDGCLYTSQTLEKDEQKIIKNEFISTTHGTESNWNLALSTCNVYRECFYKFLDILPANFDSNYDIPDINLYLKPDNELKDLLQQIKYRKFCFTNGCKRRAITILKYLQLYYLFDAIVCGDDVDTEFICKPTTQSFEFFENYIEMKDKRLLFFFDDFEDNIKAAKERGWSAIHVTTDIKVTLKEVIKKLQ